VNKGKITQIIGPVVDLQFQELHVPAIYNAIEIPLKNGPTDNKLVLEVQQHLGGGAVRAVSMSSTDGLQRGMEAIDTEDSISVPGGPEVLGRIFNVLGRGG